MEEIIKVCDEAGEITIRYEEMLTYHGRDFYGGVALAFKVLKLAFEKLTGEAVPHRNKIRLVVGFDPPGVMDALEFATRAITRRRLMVDPAPPHGPASVFGRYYFEVHYEGRMVALWLKPGLLPADFTLLARKAFAGIAEADEIDRWKGYKRQLGHDLMAMAPEEILEVKGPLAVE